ncbi:MBL fold metallo-hydrolase [Inquilinus limosus]|uniref:Beta-lactamase n=1 Tax=Inquilinus limosus MP06 TaxID=1398085 RepID=A0A0A0D9K4_9PROT|nr:MBL fold metallo-hydrolase [Inquilinus limosus]KGM34730.1 beta-lactamase [Inquilinus limosus MP06]
MGSPSFRIGDAVITRIDEIPLSHRSPVELYPEIDPEAGDRHRGRLPAGAQDPETGAIGLSIHSWLVRTPRHTLLIDTATGNGKERPGVPVMHRLDVPYLQRLEAAGVRPEDVDHVLLTHVHADHVGWNTRLAGGRWVPTFANARHHFSAVEQRYGDSLSDPAAPEFRPDPVLGAPRHPPLDGVYQDSVRPVIEAGLADLVVVDGGEVLDGISFHPAPGHSIDHAVIRLRSRGEEALFAGDVMHHPLQIFEPGWNSRYCEFPEPARASRRWLLETAAESGALVLPGHFPDSSAGRITRQGDRFDWTFA